MKKQFQQSKKSSKKRYKKGSQIKEIIRKRYYIVLGCIGFLFCTILGSLFYIQVIRHDYYVKQVELLSTKRIEGSSVPRGRIYDRNHKLLVDNVPVKTIYYKREPGITVEEEIEVAYLLGSLISLDSSNLTEDQLKRFWLACHSKLGDEKIKETEWQQLSERKITKDDIFNLKMERIEALELQEYDEEDRKVAYIYTLMNKGYSYAEKVIKNKDISDEEYALVSENLKDLKGVNTKLDWERSYPYGNVLKSILGTVSGSNGIPYELKDYYLGKGYSLSDRVGVSYLEYQYEDLLKGTKDEYKVLPGGEYQLIKEGARGYDLVLTIDIELQQMVEQVLEEQILKAKSEPNTNFYNRSFVVITDPQTGEVLAMAGKQIVMREDGYTFYDYTPGILTSPIVVGSAVKGASHIVGYNTGALKIGEVRDDTCIKIASTNEKCSWKYLGVLDDLTALKQSSNTYQFRTAIKVAGAFYAYNQPLLIDESAFDIYRNTFAQFGLGVKTEIDLPVESLGYKGGSTVSGHLLDFSIGQYDTYTPIQMVQYIGTIASGGKRIAPHLLKEVYEPTKEPLSTLKERVEPKILNTVDTQEQYLNRVKEGFKMVMEKNGTGYYSMPLDIKPAGKTGTSQSFVDSDGDGKVDTETITTTFVGYAPYDQPVMSMAVLSPDTYYQSSRSDYQSPVNRKISYEVSKKFFEIYQ